MDFHFFIETICMSAYIGLSRFPRNPFVYISCGGEIVSSSSLSYMDCHFLSRQFACQHALVSQGF